MAGSDQCDYAKMTKGKIEEKWGDRVCLWGNIDLVHMLPYGIVAEVEAEVKQRIKEAGLKGRYI